MNYATWRLLKQEFLLAGRVMPEGGNLRVEYELFDVSKQTRILGEAKIAPGTAARDLAHQVADSVYEKILGVRGAFWTRIAYVTASGTGNNRHYQLMVADSDGFNSQAVVSSPQPILSPSWSPDGKRLAYVSFDRGNSSIYIQNLTSSGTRTRRELPRNQRRAELLARRHEARDDALEERQPRGLRDGPWAASS